MINHRLNIILKKSSKSKYRKGFVKYLSSLDYKEFESLFLYYTNIISTLIIRYSTNKIKFLSKKWFNNLSINRKYNKLYYLFFNANSDYMAELSKNIQIRNEKREKLLQEIEQLQNIIKTLYSKEIIISTPLEQQNIIDMIILMSNAIDAEEELKKLIEELKTY
jgi:hypothetical protein